MLRTELFVVVSYITGGERQLGVGSKGFLVVVGGYGRCVVVCVFVFMGLVVVWNCGVTGIGSLSPWDHFWRTSTSLPFVACRMFVTPSGVCGYAAVVVGDVPAGVGIVIGVDGTVGCA